MAKKAKEVEKKTIHKVKLVKKLEPEVTELEVPEGTDVEDVEEIILDNNVVRRIKQ